MYVNTFLTRLCRLEEDISLGDTQSTETPMPETPPVREGRVYGPMTYAEYLATLPLEPHDGGGMILMVGCGSPFLSIWLISLGGSTERVVPALIPFTRLMIRTVIRSRTLTSRCSRGTPRRFMLRVPPRIVMPAVVTAWASR